jgi:phosphatidate cytidylyltransferase
MALNLKTFLTRTTTAIVFVGVLLTAIFFNYISFVTLFLVVSIWGLIEFYQIAEKLGAKPYKWIGIISGLSLFMYGAISNSYYSHLISPTAILSVVIVLPFFVFIAALFNNTSNAITNLVFTLAGIIYVVLPFSLLMHIACIDQAFAGVMAPYNFHYVLGIICLIWISDVSAYLVGSLIGKHKLYERISPGKTWEGTIGATILTIACSFLIHHFFPELALKHWVVIAVLVSVFGTIGDLVESMFKRQAGIKDSGKIMPGHGGILDRFDSLLFVAPFVYAYLTLIK